MNSTLISYEFLLSLIIQYPATTTHSSCHELRDWQLTSEANCNKRRRIRDLQSRKKSSNVRIHVVV